MPLESSSTSQENSHATPTMQPFESTTEVSPLEPNGRIEAVDVDPSESQVQLGGTITQSESRNRARIVDTDLAEYAKGQDLETGKRKRSLDDSGSVEQRRKSPVDPVRADTSREIHSSTQAITLDEALEVLTKISSKETSLVSSVVQNEYWGKYKDQIGTLLQKTIRLMAVPRKTLEEVFDIDTRALLRLYSKQSPAPSLDMIQQKL